MNYKDSVKIIFPFLIIIFIVSCQSNTGTVQHTATDSILHLPVIGAYTDSIKMFPDSGKYYFDRSNLLYGMKQYELSKKDLKQAIRLQPETSMNYFGMGEVYLQQDSASLAQQYLQKAVQLNPEDVSLQLEYANATYQANQYQQAIQQLKKLEKNNPDIADIYGLESQVYASMKDTANAIHTLQRGIQLSPNNYDAFMAMGDLLRGMNNKECLVWYNKAHLLSPSNGEPAYSEGLYYEKAGDLSDAVKYFNQSVVTDGNYVNAYLALGKLYFNEKQYRRAQEIFDLGERVAPANAQVYLQRGYCYEAMGDKTKAINDFIRAVTFDKNLQEAQKALHHLQATH
jgi:tetratricopeptide (TPR) repeat protein